MTANREGVNATGPKGARTLPVLPPAGPGGGRGERRDAAENRRRILAAARDLFAAQGVDAVSMNAVARAAGIGPGTLYRRYAHKGLLCAALLEENTRAFHGEIWAEVGAGGRGASALGGLCFLLDRLVAFNEENAPFLGAIADAAWGDRRAVVYDGPFYGWLHATVTALIERAIAANECPPLDTTWFADALLAPLAIDLYLFQRHTRGYSAERIAAAMRGMVGRLLRAGA